MEISIEFKELWYHYFNYFQKNKDFKAQVDHAYTTLKKSKWISPKQIGRGHTFDKLYHIWGLYHMYLDIKQKNNVRSKEWLYADRALAELCAVMDALVMTYGKEIPQIAKDIREAHEVPEIVEEDRKDLIENYKAKYF